MIGINLGLEVAKKALSAYQLAISVYGNNIANVNTPGYSRRTPMLGESEGISLPVGRIGFGVDFNTVRRLRDRFLDNAYRRQNTTVGKYEVMEETLAQIEMILNEPSEEGLSSILDEFWNSWQELANQPESQTTRNLVKQSAVSLCQTLRRMRSDLVAIRENVDNDIRGYVQEINTLAQRIADLNRQIVTSEVSGHEACDLRDERDKLIDELSRIVNINVFEREDGSVSIMIGSEALVERTNTVTLSLASVRESGIVISSIRLGEDGREIRPTGGKLGGLLECRDTTLPSYISSLDELARAIVEAVNSVHRLGYGLDGTTGVDFFDPEGVTADTISVSDTILNDIDLIAASSDGTVGNGENALNIAALRYQAIAGGGSTTVDDFYSSLVGTLGLESSTAASHKQNEELLLQEVNARRESVKGTSIDEEMTNLIAAQHAYQAATRLVSVIDELLTTMLTTIGP